MLSPRRAPLAPARLSFYRGILRRQRSVSSIWTARARWGVQPSSSLALEISPTSLGESPAGGPRGFVDDLPHAVARAAAEVEGFVKARMVKKLEQRTASHTN
jgi:hypothetical protein